MTMRWFVAALQPGREDLAERHLDRQGFVNWMPRQVKIVRHARRRVEKRVAFFPGYTFVSFDPNRHQWRSINGTLGVRSLIMMGDRPIPCPAGLVADLQAMTDEDGIFDGSSRLKPGETVRINSGPFMNLVGTLERMDGAGRARILLKMLHGELGVTLQARDLVAAAA